MGRGNICPDGKYEGVVYVDYDNVLCYTKKDDSEQRLLKDISYEEMPEFEFDDDASQLLLDEYRTNLVNEMAKSYGVKLVEVLTGFKFIGQKMLEFETKHNGTYLFGFEESYGCLIGTHARDKDAIVATMALCEAAA